MRALPAAPTTFSEQDARRLGPLRLWLWRHPVAMDWIVAMLFGLPALVGTVVARPQHLQFIPLVVGTTAALLARRRAPVVVLAAVTALDVGAVALAATGSGFDFAIACAVYAVAANRPARVAWTGLVAAMAVPMAAILLRPDVANRTEELTSLAFLVLVAFAIGMNIRSRRAHVAQLVERANALARETEQRAQLATAEERARIAREMHDVVAHSLSVMIALADGAAAAIDRSPDSARAAVDQVGDTGRAALADMRRVLGVLRDGDATFSPPPGGTDLDHLVQSFRAAGLPVTLTVSGASLPADVGLQLSVYRIVQESLTNALRHSSRSGPVTVEVAREPGGVRIVVASPLAVPDSRQIPPGGRGIIGMRERAAIYGGSVDAGPSAASWRVRADLHWDEEDA
ncbi:MAG TPA: histidine kinase [Cellulomonas sp.]|uniref:sensor histidine kinase n=1 Tax=Cellulomonas sp. TaxID=40001 RepID=UPI002E37A01F|nr:histidine kinase [Cellulomonas sp.]HEX5331879.1 histidine kinase [Cellulomonas sp.]